MLINLLGLKELVKQTDIFFVIHVSVPYFFCSIVFAKHKTQKILECIYTTNQ